MFKRFMRLFSVNMAYVFMGAALPAAFLKGDNTAVFGFCTLGIVTAWGQSLTAQMTLLRGKTDLQQAQLELIDNRLQLIVAILDKKQAEKDYRLSRCDRGPGAK